LAFEESAPDDGEGVAERPGDRQDYPLATEDSSPSLSEQGGPSPVHFQEDEGRAIATELRQLARLVGHQHEEALDDSLFETDSEDDNDDDEPSRLLPLVAWMHELVITSYSHLVTQHARRPSLPPKQPELPRHTLVLDLDETLVHCGLEPLTNAEFAFPIAGALIYVRLRPGVHRFLETVSSLYEVVVFTASQSTYASPLLDIIEQNYHFPLIHHRLFRESCLQVQQHFIKDLSVVNRPIANIIIIDNNPVAFASNLDNGIHIKTWKKDPTDSALLDLLPALQELSNVADVRPFLQERFGLRDHIEAAVRNLQIANPHALHQGVWL
jgi:CTD small phosphatase-like protein 2